MIVACVEQLNVKGIKEEPAAHAMTLINYSTHLLVV